jgi:hypothetical protein
MPTATRYIAVTGREDRHLTDTREAVRTLIREIKAAKVDHPLETPARTRTRTGRFEGHRRNAPEGPKSSHVGPRISGLTPEPRGGLSKALA